MPAARLCCAQSRGGISATSRSDCAPAARSTLPHAQIGGASTLPSHGGTTTCAPWACKAPTSHSYRASVSHPHPLFLSGCACSAPPPRAVPPAPCPTPPCPVPPAPCPTPPCPIPPALCPTPPRPVPSGVRVPCPAPCPFRGAGALPRPAPCSFRRARALPRPVPCPFPRARALPRPRALFLPAHRCTKIVHQNLK